MTIQKESYEKILNSIQLGNSVAENDNLLLNARVETPVFEGVFNDKYDIVTGRKGAGKTAIFKLIGDLLSSYFYQQRKQIILTGVNSSGEPIFSQFNKYFKDFTENEFENFWKIYFISLVYNDFIKDPKYSDLLKDCKKEIEDFKAACYKAGIPDIPSKLTRRDLVALIVNMFKNVKRVESGIGLNPNTQLFGANLNVDMKDDAVKIAKRTSIYVHDIGEKLLIILDKIDYSIWLVLDRLDEVFERYSRVEFNGLRGLLKSYRSFDLGGKSRFKVKIFLRDDIRIFLFKLGERVSHRLNYTRKKRVVKGINIDVTFVLI